MDRTFRLIGTHSDKQREQDDFYATDPLAIDELLRVETFSHNIWECACGMNHLSYRLMDYGFNVKMSDIKKRIDDDRIEIIDFLKLKDYTWDGDIITNPPFKYAKDFILKSLSLINEGNKVAMFLKLIFLEGKDRYDNLFSIHPPKRIHVFVKRVRCDINGDFNKKDSSAVCYAWFIWEKGYKGQPVIDWINVGTKKESEEISLFDIKY